MSHLLSRTSSCYEPELIPDPVCWKWRWLSQPVTIACHKMLDLGSGVVSCGILTTITRSYAGNSTWYVIACVMPACVAQPLVEGRDLKKTASSEQQA